MNMVDEFVVVICSVGWCCELLEWHICVHPHLWSQDRFRERVLLFLHGACVRMSVHHVAIIGPVISYLRMRVCATGHGDA